MTYSEPYPQNPGQTPSNGAGGTVARHRYVDIAFYLFLVVALTRLITIIVGATQIGNVTQRAKDQIANQTAGSGLSQAQVEGVLRGSIIGGLVVSVLFLIAFVVFDLLMRRGANWARIVLLVLTVLSLTGVISAYGLGAIGVIAGIIACVLMFLPASNAYFREVKARKLGGYPQQ